MLDRNLRWSHPTAQQGTNPAFLKRKNKYGVINRGGWGFFPPQNAHSSALKSKQRRAGAAIGNGGGKTERREVSGARVS